MNQLISIEKIFSKTYPLHIEILWYISLFGLFELFINSLTKSIFIHLLYYIVIGLIAYKLSINYNKKNYFNTTQLEKFDV